MVTVADFEKPFYELKQQGTAAKPKVVPLIVISWIPKGKNEPALTNNEIQQLFFGATNSVAHWFREASQGHYRLVPHPQHPVLGPFTSKYDWPFYWRNDPKYVKDRLTAQQWQNNPYKVPPPTTSPHYHKEPNGKEYYLDDEGFINGHTHSWAEAIRFAANVIDFKALDRDGDGLLSPDEALVMVVKAQRDTFGTRRPVCGSEIPDKPLIVNGVRIKEVSELYAGQPVQRDDLATAIEEVLHLAANLADQYDPAHPNDPGRPEQFSLTDAGARPVHVDPYHRMKWGWLNAKVADKSGAYTLHTVGTSGEVLIVPSPIKGHQDEFFLIENRWRGNSYDQHRDAVRGEGLAIWHCIEDPKVKGDWWRQSVITLRRADPRMDTQGKLQFNKTLFNGADPACNYTLSDSSVLQHLRLRNQAPSGIQISNISAAGATMTFDITLNTHIPVTAYQAAWNHKAHHGVIVLLFGGSGRQLEPLDYETYHSMLDMLRGENPVWFDPNQELLATEHELVGEAETV